MYRWLIVVALVLLLAVPVLLKLLGLQDRYDLGNEVHIQLWDGRYEVGRERRVFEAGSYELDGDRLALTAADSGGVATTFTVRRYCWGLELIYGEPGGTEVLTLSRVWGHLAGYCRP